MLRKQHYENQGTLGKCPLKADGGMCDGDKCSWWVAKVSADYESCAVHEIALNSYDVAHRDEDLLRKGRTC